MNIRARDHASRPHWLTIMVAAGLAIPIRAAFAQPASTASVRDLVSAIGSYVESYGQRASGVVSTERYSQTVTGHRLLGPTGRLTVGEFAIVKGSVSEPWIGFRDVIEVDGHPLTDHRDRLLSILTAPSADLDAARRLSTESARFNIGPIERNFNVPTTALFFFEPENLGRFAFKIEARGKNGQVRIGFREIGTPTMIQTSGGGAAPSEGELLVDGDGLVHQTILRTHVFSQSMASWIYSTVDVQYERLDPMGMWLPTVMTEAYATLGRSEGVRIETRADYSNYRRFETSVKIR